MSLAEGDQCPRDKCTQVLSSAPGIGLVCPRHMDNLDGTIWAPWGAFSYAPSMMCTNSKCRVRSYFGPHECPSCGKVGA